MRVAMYYNNNDVRIEEMPIPEINENEILMKVMACGICGSDVMEWYRVKKAPLVLGHEATGVVEKVGGNVKKYKKGDRVFVSHHVPCNTCHYCLNNNHTVCDTLRTTNFDPGGFSQYVRVPEINVERGVFLLPEEMSFEEGTFIEPLACVIRGQRKAGMQSGKSVLVIGSGISGILHIQTAKASDASRTFASDINDYRLKAAKRFGADIVINAKENVSDMVKELNDGRGADLVIVCTSSISAIKQVFESIDRGGTVLFFAPTKPGVEIPLPLWELWHDGITITNSYAGSPRDIAEAIEIIREKKVNVVDMITHRLGLEEAGKGFRIVASAQDSIKVIIEPQR
ncbi:alcohol dehydrogenase [Candidatus Desantisbacteria bacterium CG07_land_8_20_14_0_80_39_15]|uniref:Alcohol dehydrogenase n=1 Tax=Candidatus Desantisbacteria bacterium CG07_land_8_20_14_0_80_39_15 TaxID=1974549 RepID=A0A2M6ZFZ1_9BACT|nr:MAG: alcohol dehydrogenase [Candidatus Desantisbacteria bacterium CG07_land_8_20_14_0_80_39_15]